MKTLGVLTSGGDAQGMNPALRAVVRTSTEHDCRVVGINKSCDGIFDGTCEELGGRCKRMYTPEGVDEARRSLAELGIQGLVVRFGGDASLPGALELSR